MNAAATARDFLVEIGTEELPPKALRELMEAFAANLAREVDDARLGHGAVHAYASPRRLAVRIDALATAQDDRVVEQKGPPVSVAFDADGQPKPPALAFAGKCGVEVGALGRIESDKGAWLSCSVTEKGIRASELLPVLVDRALAALPIPRRMRWGAGDAEFVRPVHWVVMLHGERIVEGELKGIAAGRATRGHRFHADRPLDIATPADYLDTLERDGRVIADFDRRRRLVEEGVAAAAAAAGGAIVDGDALYDEVAALVEWPVPLVGAFDERFLELPREVIVSTLTGHQRYFPLAGADGRLLPRFVTVANIESSAPERVRDGNERVIRPRLADAAFFWDTDRQRPLADRTEALAGVVYQKGLGSVHDKSLRVATLAAALAADQGVPPATVERAGRLAKCDLLTGMVGEFPELQGVMGRYYALADGEDAAVAKAIGDHYRPRFAGDALPESIDGRLLAMADKLDTMAGAFALGRKPTGNRDPFALRRAALGVVRLQVEGGLDIDLKAALALAAAAQPPLQASGGDTAVVTAELYAFVTDRLRRYFLDGDPALATETFDAVLAREPVSLVDFAARLGAVQSFVGMEEAASLAAANKRIANILRKADDDGIRYGGGTVRPAPAGEPAEAELGDALARAALAVQPLLERRDYTAALKQLAALRTPIDRFFDDVLVMADDERVRASRLELLASVRNLFLRVADISRLAIEERAPGS
ncbi:MAG TPA: glycine--tRNA ligase subunit beta [Woeseiaceae bacterium]|nr:glycine--tRNA ligase subunit beta [Woeseiaceae bacterium]